MWRRPTRAIVAGVEIVIVVGKVAHGYESLALILVELDIETPLRDAGNNAGVNLAEAVGHILDLLELYGGSLGVGCELLHIGRVLALLLELLEVDGTSAGEITLEQSGVPSCRGSGVWARVKWV